MTTLRALPYLVALLALLTSAQNNGLPSAGPYKPGVGDTPEALQVSEAAGRQPNSTNAVTFTRIYNNTPETWGWRINISDIAIPNRISDLGQPSANYSEGLRVANTQWQLEWPGNNGSLKSFLDERQTTISFTALVSNKPSNITDRYNDADNGNCTAILGNQCTQSLSQAASRNAQISFLTLEGCENSLNVANGPDGSSSFGSNTSTLEPGNTLFYRTSEAYPATNSTQVQRAKTALQILIMSFQDGGAERGDASGPTILCRIVAKDSSMSAAPARAQSNIMLWSIGILTTLILVVV